MVQLVERARHDRRMLEEEPRGGMTHERRQTPERRSRKAHKSFLRTMRVDFLREKIRRNPLTDATPGLQSVEDAAAWAAQNGGEKALLDGIEHGAFGGDLQSNAYARLWLLQQEDARRNSSAREERELLRQELVAAESCAASARQSAESAVAALQAARTAQRWAYGAMAVALLAVVLLLVK